MTHTVAVFDCFSGIAGDMTLAALIDAGAPLAEIERQIQALPLPPFSLTTERVRRGGIEALHLHVEVSEERRYRPEEMLTMVTDAPFPERVRERARRAIDALAGGEAAAHGTDTPVLHEAGGVDAVIDIAGTMLALEALGVDAAVCPVVTVGAGTIARTEHGPIPAAPGPAATAILEGAGFPLRFVEAGHELVTPTGAAILAAVARPGAATVTLARTGTGAGTFDPANRPNALRILIGEAEAPRRRLTLLEANIDDMAPTLVALAGDRLLAEGALDAWTESIGMKKGRAAVKLCALVHAGEEERFAAVFARETTTLGVRTTAYERFEAERRIEQMETSLGMVRVKRASWFGTERAAPEPDDVRALAEQLGRPTLEVQRALERELGGGERPPPE